MIRIGNASGFWGDWPQAAAMQIRSGPLDYLTMDYMAEVTLSIMNKLKTRNPEAGYASDFVSDIGDLLPEIMDKGVRVLASAGGVNCRACAEGLLNRAEEHGIKGLKVGIVEGDDILGQLRGGNWRDLGLAPFDPAAEPIDEIAPRLLSANAYLGAFPIVEALRGGAHIVVTGRVADPSLILAPIIHEFDLSPTDWDALSLGTIIGHILECGAQSTGGNFLGDYWSVPRPELMGFPIAEMDGPDRAVITKHASLGGLVTQASIKEQLIYELHDPEAYLTPDVVADFTSIRLTDDGPDRVAIDGVRGKPAPETLKVSCVYPGGWKITGEISYCWPEAVRKARAAGEMVRKRVENRLGPDAIEDWMIECVGYDSLHPGMVGDAPEPQEVVLRISARSSDRAALEYLGREIAPLVLTGPPGVTGYGGPRPRASQLLAFWGGLVSRDKIEPRVEVLG